MRFEIGSLSPWLAGAQEPEYEHVSAPTLGTETGIHLVSEACPLVVGHVLYPLVSTNRPAIVYDSDECICPWECVACHCQCRSF